MPKRAGPIVFASSVLGLACSGLLLGLAVAAPAPTRAAERLTTAQDHARSLKLLNVSALRPGANGRDPSAPDAANADEARAGLASPLPDPLRLESGAPVRSRDDWWRRRRPEIVELFDREIYGRAPRSGPAVRWTLASSVRETQGGTPVVVKRWVGRVEGAGAPVEIPIALTTPADTAGPVPVILELVFPPRPGLVAGGGAAPGVPAGQDGRALLLAKGWGYASMTPVSVQADDGAGLTRGVIGLVNRGRPRDLDDWGALRAWAWGASRALDALGADPAVDAKRVGVAGLSRYGKAALLAMAYDPRFAIVFAGSSGAGGAKLMRRDFGERVENLASSGEYHWMAGNFLRYAGPPSVADLPVDAHQLLALCAPRPVFIGVGAPEAERWVDPRGMFLAAVAAGPVYRLLGARGLSSERYPALGASVTGGELAFRQHEGGHTLGPNWPAFLLFAERYLAPAPSRKPTS